MANKLVELFADIVAEDRRIKHMRLNETGDCSSDHDHWQISVQLFGASGCRGSQEMGQLTEDRK